MRCARIAAKDDELCGEEGWLATDCCRRPDIAPACDDNVSRLRTKVRTMKIVLARRGEVTLSELEARYRAYLSAGAPEPVLEGPLETQRAIWTLVASRGDSQMRALMDRYLTRTTSG